MWVNINVSGSGYVWWMLIIDEIFTRRLYKEKNLSNISYYDENTQSWQFVRTGILALKIFSRVSTLNAKRS